MSCHTVSNFGDQRKDLIFLSFNFSSQLIYVLTGAPWYNRNPTLHKILRIRTISEFAYCYFKKFHNDTRNYPGPLIANLHNPTNLINPIRRLKRNWARDLL